MDPPGKGTDGASAGSVADRPGHRSVVLRLGLAAAIVVLTCACVTARLFVWPAEGAPKSADAVVMLSGDHGERLPRALALIRSGVSATLVHVGEPDSPEARALCEKPQTFEVVCLRPEPDSTRAEAMTVGQLAGSRGWRTVVVVTSTQHVARAGLLFRRCVDGTVDVVGARPAFGWRLTARLIVEESAKIAYSLTVRRGC